MKPVALSGLKGPLKIVARRAGTLIVKDKSGRHWACNAKDLQTKSNPSTKTAVDDYVETHWGNRPSRVSRIKRPNAPPALTVMGELHSVIYKTAKGQPEDEYFEHEFERPRPKLAFGRVGKKKRLFVVGGGYDVKGEGIVG